MAGFIYIMSNPAFPNLLKIGKSKKDPTIDRVHELNQTGVPEPFKVEYYAFVENEDYLEKAVHTKLKKQRPNMNREFFEVECITAIDIIHELSSPHSKIKYEEIFYVSLEDLKKRRIEKEEAEQLEKKRILQQQEKERELERLVAEETKRVQNLKAEKKAKLSRKNQLQNFVKIENRKAENNKFLFRLFIFVLIILILAGVSS